MGPPVSLCDGGLDVRRLVTGKSNGDRSSRETTEEDDCPVFSGEEEEEEVWSEDRFCFYFVKHSAYDDPEIKAKIDEADNEIYYCNSERIHIANRLKAKRAERLSLVASLESLAMDQEVNSLSERLSEVEMEMEMLDAQMGWVLDQRDKAFERIKFLRKQRDKGNAAFFQSRVVMKKAIELAASGNFRDVEELANSEVDKFMSRWNNDKAFRDDYKKRIMPSLEERKMRRNEQIRSSESDVDTENRDETAGNKGVELKRFSTEEEEKESDDAVYEKLEKEEEEIDEESLKEKKREEQLEKARLAMERKRKLQEKAAAKAAIREKKEAEKKLKELEKRAKKKKKKASSPSDQEITPEIVTEGSEQEKTGKEEKPLNGRSVSWTQRSLRYRYHKKGSESVPKAILKRRRAYKLWVWSVSSAAVALPLALLIAFFYFQ